MITLERTMNNTCDEVIDSSEQDEVTYRRELIAAVNEAIAEIDRGEFITLEELKKEFSSWIID